MQCLCNSSENKVNKMETGLNILCSIAGKLPLSIRVLLEAAIRKCDGFYVREEHVQNLLAWQEQQNVAEVPFPPSRVLLQDFT